MAKLQHEMLNQIVFFFKVNLPQILDIPCWIFLAEMLDRIFFVPWIFYDIPLLCSVYRGFMEDEMVKLRSIPGSTSWGQFGRILAGHQP